MNKKQKRAAEAAAATLAAQREAESVENFEWRDDDFQLCGLSHIKADVNFQAQSFWRDARIRFMRNKGAVFALFCIAAIILLAILGPMMTCTPIPDRSLPSRTWRPVCRGWKIWVSSTAI